MQEGRCRRDCDTYGIEEKPVSGSENVVNDDCIVQG